MKMLTTLFSSGVSAAAAAYAAKEYCDSITVEMLEFFKQNNNREAFLIKFGRAYESVYVKLINLSSARTNSANSNNSESNAAPNSTNSNREVNDKLIRIRVFGARNQLRELETLDTNNAHLITSQLISTKLVPLLLKPHGPITNASSVAILEPTGNTFDELVNFLTLCINIFEMNA